MKISSLEEYKTFAGRHHLPLNQMRFALGEDKGNEPRWFYIYQDSSTSEWVVAKNKSNGEKVERYRGNDEAAACQILFNKMEEEARSRGLLRSQQQKAASIVVLNGETVNLNDYEDSQWDDVGSNWDNKDSSKKGRPEFGIIVAIIVLSFDLIVGAVAGIISFAVHNEDGYYVDSANNIVLYKYGLDFYYLSTADNGWYSVEDSRLISKSAENYKNLDFYEDYEDLGLAAASFVEYESAGDSDDYWFDYIYYNDDYNYDFYYSETYQDIVESENESTSDDSDWDSDYSSWDSNDTNWDSDW